MHVVATAGHVDHGKSTLLAALTGIDPDRLAEEKARGLTIDLGFAWMSLPSGREVGFVDVPGHVRYLPNMLAGVGAVDVCLFVVAATDGWKPQSEEHLRILELLGVRHGMIALTKASLVDADRLELARLEVEERVASTFLEGARVVAVDAADGAGVGAVADALDGLLADVPTATDRGRPRLWVDRSFAARGSGTVVTGTLTGGAIAVGDELVVAPGERAVRVRGLQTHGSPLVVAPPGRRLAVNLSGASHPRPRRGDALVHPGQWFPSGRLDATLTVLASLSHDVGRRGSYLAYVGSGEHPVSLRVLGGAAIGPGAAGQVRLHLTTRLPLQPGDRFVLRETGRGETVGGGEVLDVDPILPAARARPDRSVERVVRERGWVTTELLERLTGEQRKPDVGDWVVDPEVLAAAGRGLRSAVDAAPDGLDVAALDGRERAVLATLDGIVVAGGLARAATSPPAAASEHPFVAALEATPFAPPTPHEAGVPQGELRRLLQAGVVVERDGICFSASAVDRAARVVATLLSASPEGVTVSQVREALGTTRKYVLPLLGHLDATGVTRRRGDVRVGGLRLPSPSAEEN